MPKPPDPRWGISPPTGGDDANVPKDFDHYRERLMAVGATITQGPGDTPITAVGHLHWKATAGGALFVGEGVQARPVVAVPVGGLLFWPGPAAPTSPTSATWLPCDGAAVPIAQFPELYAEIGRTWTAQNVLATLFAVPNFSGRTPVAAGSADGGTNRTVGQTGGAERHTLSTTEMPSHNHGGATGGGTTGGMNANNPHTHFTGGNGNSIVVPVGSSPAANLAGGGGFGIQTPVLGGADINHGHSVPALGITAQGGGGAHNNMAPFAVVSVHIRAR